MGTEKTDERWKALAMYIKLCLLSLQFLLCLGNFRPLLIHLALFHVLSRS